MYLKLGPYGATAKTEQESAEAKFRDAQSLCKAPDPKHEEAKKLLATSRKALERCVGSEQDVRAGKADLNKESISRADDYGELAEEKYDQVVDLAEACEQL